MTSLLRSVVLGLALLAGLLPVAAPAQQAPDGTQTDNLAFEGNPPFGFDSSNVTCNIDTLALLPGPGLDTTFTYSGHMTATCVSLDILVGYGMSMVLSIDRGSERSPIAECYSTPVAGGTVTDQCYVLLGASGGRPSTVSLFGEVFANGDLKQTRVFGPLPI